MDKYDYIIAGAGCAGLSLLYHLMNDPVLSTKKILVIDKSFNKSNDRTWCFWEEGIGVFESIVCQQWEVISVHKAERHFLLPTSPFRYKMIQGIDFYNYIIEKAKEWPSITWKEGLIADIEDKGGVGCVRWNGGEAEANYVFSSILNEGTLYDISQKKLTKPFLWQHFKGRLVEFEEAVFDTKVAKLMDFNVDQKGHTAFMYLLPLTNKTALVEYTLFSPDLLEDTEYDQVLDTYLEKEFAQKKYAITHVEKGAIPMTSVKLSASKFPIYTIGTLGNAVKSSTGYAFHFIQEQSKKIVKALATDTTIDTEVHQSRHQFYDAVLLYILYHHKMEGSEIFTSLFSSNTAATIFKFLSNTSTIGEDLQIMRTLPTRIFLPAAIRVMASSYNG